MSLFAKVTSNTMLKFTSGRVVAPDLNEPVIKSPRRIPFFKNMLLRDLKLDRQVGGKPAYCSQTFLGRRD